MADSITKKSPLFLACLFLLGLTECKSETKTSSAAPANSTQSPQPTSTASPGKYGAFQDIFVNVAKKVVPSVVSISTERTITAPPNPFDFFFDQDDMRNFFGLPDRGTARPAPRKFRQNGLGSGFITSADGFILTNNHVVEGAEKLKVQLSDEREFEAEVVGTDKPSDLAVVKIKGKVPPNLAPMPFGDSDKLQIGEWVVAVGAPYGLYESVTTGIISAKGRENTGLSTYGNFLQTDAAINPGNSGGPLVNLDGGVIGINTAIYSQSGGYQGIGFAIPINLAKNVMESLIKHGKVTRGWLGISIQSISPDMAEALGLKDKKGALIGDVVQGGPADKAGLRRGDVVLKLADREILDANDLMNQVAGLLPGAKVDIAVFRDGKQFKVTAVVAKREEEKIAKEERESPEQGGDVTSMGLEVADLTDEVRQHFQIGKSVKAGAVVMRVDPDGSASEAGIEEGDVILEANHAKVANSAQLVEAVRKAGKGKKILFLVNRKGSTFYSVIKPK